MKKNYLLYTLSLLTVIGIIFTATEARVWLAELVNPAFIFTGIKLNSNIDDIIKIDGIICEDSGNDIINKKEVTTNYCNDLVFKAKVYGIELISRKFYIVNGRIARIDVSSKDYGNDPIIYTDLISKLNSIYEKKQSNDYEDSWSVGDDIFLVASKIEYGHPGVKKEIKVLESKGKWTVPSLKEMEEILNEPEYIVAPVHNRKITLSIITTSLN